MDSIETNVDLASVKVTSETSTFEEFKRILMKLKFILLVLFAPGVFPITTLLTSLTRSSSSPVTVAMSAMVISSSSRVTLAFKSISILPAITQGKNVNIIKSENNVILIIIEVLLKKNIENI